MPNEDENQKQNGGLLPALLSGPVIGLLAAFGLELLVRSPLHAFTPFPISLMTVVVIYSVFRSGVASGMISSVIAIAYLGHYLDTTGAFSSNSPDAWNRLISWTIALPIVVLIVGKLRTRSLKAATFIERERGLHRITEAIPQLVWTAGSDGKQDFFNVRWTEYTGQTLEQTNQQGWEALVHPDDFQKLSLASARSLAYSQAYETEFRLKRAVDGQLRWHLMRTIPLKNEHGRVTKWFGTCTDIHDQKVAYAELVEAKKRVDTVISTSDAILFSLDQNGMVTFSDGKGLVHVNRRAGQSVGHSVFELYKDNLEFIRLIKKSLQGESATGRVRLNGLWHEMHIDPTFDGAGLVSGATGVAFNVNERATSEKALIETQAKLKAILQHVPFAFWAVDLSRRFIFREGSGMVALGLDGDEMIGRQIDEVYQGHPEIIASMDRAFRGEGFQAESKIRDRVYNIAYTPSFDNQGKILGISGITFDITEKKQMESEKNELELRARAASEASQIKSGFLANMSHEIRTPINGVIGMLGLVSDTKLNGPQREYIDAAKASADSLLTVINDILDFSKVESGKLEFEDIEFDLPHLFKDVAKAFNFEAQAKGISLHLHLDSQLPKNAGGDPGRLRQILNNLVSNAIKFTPSGKVSLTAKFEGLTPAGNKLRIEVQDTGIGIPEAAISKMFQSFSQADASTTRRFGGTGLGLSICKQLVEKMHGTIGVESSDGEGSTFWVTLVLRTAVAVARMPTTAVGSFAGLSERRLRVLIAEDNPINQKIALKVLEKMGLSAEAVANGHEVIDALRRIPYDLVLMDCQMPELDGYEATKLIRSSKTLLRADIPIIAMTANAIVGDKQRCLDAGMNDYISKPVKTDELFTVLHRWLKALMTKKLDISSKPQELETAVVDEMEHLDPLLQSRRSAPVTIVDELLGLWVADMSVRLEKIKRAFDTKQMALIVANTQQLRAISTSIGSVRVVDQASALENAALDSNHETLKVVLEKLEGSVREAQQKLCDLIEDPRSDAA